MKRWGTIGAIAVWVGALVPAAVHAQGGPAAQIAAGPASGIVYARGHEPQAPETQTPSGHAPGAGSRKRSPDMTYHGGVIMPTYNVYPIFWGTSWPGYSGDKMSGTDSFYTGFSGSNYAKTSDEYTGSNGQVGPTGTARVHVVDGTQASGGGSTTTILNEVAKEINAGKVPLDTSGNGYYPVYTDVPRGNAGYCAWHSSGTVNGYRVEFAFFFNLDGDAGCDPQSNVSGESQGLAALANVGAHELSEARTDPASPGAWYDSSGNENGDKCAWTFNVAYVTFSNGTKWKVQGEWSNAAYDSGTGYPNSYGQYGCLDGH
jgi:hypothetical protein